MKKIILLILLSFFSFAGYSQLNEGFEGAPATPDASGVWVLPTSNSQGFGNWLVRDNRTNSNPNWQLNNPPASFPAHTGTNAAFINRENTGIGVLSEEWLITPQLNIQANTQLRFWTRQTLVGSPDPQTIYRVLASSSATQGDLTAFTTVLAEYNEATLSTLTPDQLDYEEKLIDLGFVGLRYIAFVKVYTQPAAALSGDRWLVDDVRTLQRCIDPIAPLGATNITTTSATVTWTMPAGSTQTQFEIEYGLSGFTQGTGTIVPATTPASGVRTHGLTGLTDTTCYQFYVRSVCPESNSLWVGPFNFCTLPRGTTCADPIVVTPLPYTSTSNTGLYANNITAGTPGTNCGGGAGFLGGNDVVYSYTVPATTTGIISISMDPQGQANTGVFVYSSCANVGTNCIAGVGNNNGTIRTIPTLNVTSGQTIYIVISSTAAVGTFPYVLTIQDVNCAPPTNLSALAIDTSSATLSWQAPSGTTPGYEYYVQTAGSPIPGTAGTATTGTSVTANALTVDGTPLAVGTNYQYWVRADCGNGTFSPWAGPFPFQTTSCTTGACNYTFVMTDSFGDGWNGALMNVVQNSVVVATIGSTFTGGTGPVSVTVPLCNTVPFSLIWTTAGNFPGEVGVSIQNSFGQTIFTKPSGTGAAGTTPIFTGTVDCLNPLCLEPTNLTVTNITTYGATLQWTPNGTNPIQSWDIYVVTTGSPAPTAGSTPTYNTTNNPFTITQASLPQGLLPDTAYTYYVRAHCNATDTSPWSGASASFTTLPTCPKPINLVLSQFDLNSIQFDWTPQGTETAWEYIVTLAGDPAPLPTDPGWNPTSTHPVTALFLPPATSFDFYVRAICTPGTDESTIAGPVTGNTTICAASDQCNYTFTLNDSFGDGWNGATMQVRQNGIVVATLGTTFTAGTGPIVVTVPLCTGVPFDLFWNNAGTFPGEVRVAISNNFDQTLFAITTPSAALANTVLYTATFDCLLPACLPPATLTSSNITAHEADLNWVQNGTATPASWEIYAVPAGSPAPTATSVGIIVSSAGVPPYHITGLLADTDYVFYVRALCNGASSPTSEWSTVSPIFHTLPTCPKPTNLLVSNSDMDSLQFSWLPGGSETSWEYIYLPAGSPPPTAATTGWIPSSTTIVTVTGLTSATAYDFYVRGICTPGVDISTISGPATGNTTICAASSQCNYTFVLTDSFGDGWNGATIQVRQNGIVIATLGSTFTGGAGPITITVPVCPDIPFDLFWNNAGTFPGEVRIVVTNNFSQTLYSITTASQQLVGTVLYSLALPSCTVPLCQTPVALNAAPFTYNASLTWNFVPGSTYDVFVVPAGSPAPTATTVPTYPGVSTNPFLTDATGPNALTPNSDYTFYVRMVCPTGPPTDWSTGFNFTTLPTCPQPQNLHAETTTTDATITFNEVGPATSWEVWVLPAGSPAPAPGSGTIFNQTPVGGVVTINTLVPAPNGLGLTLFPGLYNFYVRSICSPTDASAPITGPLAFFILNVDPICASVIPNNPQLNSNGEINLCPGTSCVDITATYTDNKDTSSYVIEPIPFAPPFPFDGGTELNIGIDDIWGDVFTLPFNFCFFGTNYPTVQVGSNGVLSFGSNFPANVGGGCPWNTDPAVTVPNVAFPIRNAIYGVYQDINPAVSTLPIVHTINYQVLGTAPCRTFVLNFVNIGQFSCGTSVGLQTSQIVLYETSNNIEVYVKDRTVCPNWNEGSGVIGIQNAAGTTGYTPPGRNLGPWEAHNEAWRFKPDGASNVVFSWLDQNGALITHDTTLANYCVSETTTVTAQAVYNGCGGVVTTKTSDVILKVNEIDIAPIPNVTTCQCYTLPALPVGNYYTQPNGLGDLIPVGTVLCTAQTVYVHAELVTPTQTCTDDESFTITIAPITAPVLPDVTVCVNYTLPNLNNPDYNYYTDTGGVGTMYPGTGGTVISATTTLYIFGVVGDCNAESMFTITIDGSAPTVPTFDPIADICIGGTAPSLPSISTNGIPGTWSPATIDTTTPGNACYVFTPNPDQLCTATATLCVTTTNQIIPTFNPIPNICQNAQAPAFPTTSINGIIGTWSVIDTSMTGPQTITFTPATGQSCAISTTATVTIDPSVTATFAPIQDLCQNSVPPLLPLTSSNGINGTWNPPTVDTSVLGSSTYIFTPDPGQPCTSGTTITVNIITPVQPNFAPITICHSTPAPPLLTTSPNGITGSWSPATIDNTLSADYTFTPDAGQCATTQIIHVTITPQIAPDFAPIAGFCAGAQVPVLATTSPNGISGTWTPSVIDNLQTGCYTFTPNAGLCSEPQTICVNVTPRDTPNFSFPATVCPGVAVPVLGTTSPNTIQGTWNPAVVSEGNSTYVFTPDAGQCANSQSVTINVISMPTIEFTTGCTNANYFITLNNPNPQTNSNYSWQHNGQAIAGANGTAINLTALGTGTGTYTINFDYNNCPVSEDITILSISCDIQRGISPRGTGTGDNLNDSFDLTGQNVSKLEIFNRYGTKVYSKNNYSNEWYGQSDKGEELPDATYFYVIEYNNGGTAKTGWIYINREQ